MTPRRFCLNLKVMNYNNTAKGRFINRPNRFIAQVETENQIHTVHVKNTGRCRELLTDSAVVILEESQNPARKTKYDLIAVYKGDNLINMDSQAPNKAVGEWLKKGEFIKNPTLIKAEKTFGSSRLDFYVESQKEKTFIEVKGVTLEVNGVAKFPDAPTQRGAKHLKELISAKKQGYRAVVLFVIQMKGCKFFTPNADTDPLFAKALKEAKENGVEIVAADCIVTENSMTIDKSIEVKL